MTGTTLCSGIVLGRDAGHDRPLYGPSDSKVSPRFSGIRTYARLPHVAGRLEGVDVAIVGIPFDTGGTYRVGARFGPEHIRSASALMRPYHSGSGVPIFDRLSVVDYGDLPVVPGYVEESHGRIAAGLLEVVQAGVIPIDLGGDHSIALPELRALAKVHGKVALIQLDSHSDTSEEYFGQPHTHGTPFYHAVKEGLVEPSRSIQVGLRGPVYSDRDYAIPREMGMEVITGVEAHELGMEAVAQRIVSRVGKSKVFFSFDIDFIDPAYAPATGTPEIGGFTTWEAQSLMRRLAGLNYVAFDVVEVIPAYDVADNTSFVAANIVYEFLALLARAR
ncbi:MAG: agmatinase [Chloroflexi bacterium]|nr:MAG: agmatinase [Chloroflexota bacterium]TMG59255.1 MAG: agmatinase [Chloroflexota bacterium]